MKLPRHRTSGQIPEMTVGLFYFDVLATMSWKPIGICAGAQCRDLRLFSRTGIGRQPARHRIVFGRIRKERPSPHRDGHAEVDAGDAQPEIRLGLLRQIAAWPALALSVVCLALRGVREDDERFGDLAEMLDRFLVRIDVGMKGPGELPVDCFDLLRGRVWRSSEHVVEVTPRHTRRISSAASSGIAPFREMDARWRSQRNRSAIRIRRATFAGGGLDPRTASEVEPQHARPRSAPAHVDDSLVPGPRGPRRLGDRDGGGAAAAADGAGTRLLLLRPPRP